MRDRGGRVLPFPQFPDDAFKAFAYEHVAQIGKALSSPQRLVLLNILAQGPRTVEVLAELSALSVANASRHLQTLKASGLVVNERKGQHVVYTTADDCVKRFIGSVKEMAWTCSVELRHAVEVISESPTRAQSVSRDELLSMVSNADVVVVDVRPAEEYTEGHLPGAVSVPLDELEARLAELPPGREVVAYCRGRYCILADRAVELLKKRGVKARRTDADVLEWEAAGLPLERTPAHLTGR
jgi:rhodanese-related sulfurtransferase/DNA-binding transcriptional ArsR family regulator